jgi:hypothetical protein
MFQEPLKTTRTSFRKKSKKTKLEKELVDDPISLIDPEVLRNRHKVPQFLQHSKEKLERNNI